MANENQKRIIAGLLDHLQKRAASKRISLIQRGEDGYSCLYQPKDLQVIVSFAVERDGLIWGHLSVTRHSKRELPTHAELRFMKRLFFGDIPAYQVFPTDAKAVNINPYVLHLFCCVERRDYLPDFTQGGRSI